MGQLTQSNTFWLTISFALGFGLILFVTFVLYLMRRAQALSEAKEIITDAEDNAKEIEEAAKKRVADFTEQLTEQAERENSKVEERIAVLEEKIQARTDVLEDKIGEIETAYQKKQSEVDQFQNAVHHFEKKYLNKKEIEKNLLLELIKKAEAKAETTAAQVKSDLARKFTGDVQVESSKALQVSEEVAAQNSETEAKRLLHMALNRFARPYCPERGIGYLNFETPEQRDRVLGKDQENLRIAETLCGVDLNYDENHNAVNVYGFDPVRRELGRSTVERMMEEKGTFNKARIEQIYAKAKRDLFQRILNDGNRIAKELRIDGLHAEVKNMMGALRYRYSFTQNQHFHCAEVGFLAGVLGAELDIPVKDARRAGLLHDIGKAMDHSVEGGHAVLGADFIKQHGELDHIVHAVRAHHFDETPNSDLAYVVIASDALSGARPGARRSTATSYTQKIQDLQSISGQMEGVIDTHILSAGREVRVYVDGARVDDLKALQISKDLATRIENEMSYPGQIKVTVVRETHAIEYAK